MAKKKKRSAADSPRTAIAPSLAVNAKGNSRKTFFVALLGIAALAAIIYFWRTDPTRLHEAELATVKRVGGVYQCKGSPGFVRGGGAQLSTSERGVKGLALVRLDGGGRRIVEQLPSWGIAGNLAPIQVDRDGNVWTAPAPVINVLDNPAALQNTLYKVESGSGELRAFMALPPARAGDTSNPFGLLGLAYDCDDNTLFASSVMGSTRGEIKGRIFHIDLASKKVIATLNDVDAMGLAPFHTGTEKRLYFGAAREPMVRSILLSEDGKFLGSVRDEINLDGLGPRGDDRARRLSIATDNTLTVHGVEFNFNLIAPTEKQETLYRYRFDESSARWQTLN
jgi:hypothetical protein